jgi:hypothetical protein
MSYNVEPSASTLVAIFYFKNDQTIIDSFGKTRRNGAAETIYSSDVNFIQ